MAAARAARQVERAAEWEQKAAEAALAKAVREMERACGAGAKRRRYTCGKCRDAGLPHGVTSGVPALKGVCSSSHEAEGWGSMCSCVLYGLYGIELRSLYS